MFDAPRASNRILSFMAPDDYARVMRDCESVRMPLHEIVSDLQQPTAFVYFPLTCVFSAVILMEDGAMSESGTIGREGLSGFSALVNRRATPMRIIQQVEGESLRMPIAKWVEALKASPALRHVIEAYTLTLLQFSSQTAACNLHHTVEERMSRWLMLTADRVGRDEFYLTQEFLSVMLGVRRQSVSLAGGILQRAGLIGYRRGNIQIIDREGLEDSCCECYRASADMYDQLMALPPE